jgi:TrwC relaxase
VGYDLTLTTEKALSVLGLLSGDPTRRAVLDAIRVGNDRALDWLEHHAAITRVNGKPVPTTGWTVASFRHVTSRALDPFPHHHNVIANTVEDRTGARRTLDARGRYQHAQAPPPWRPPRCATSSPAASGFAGGPAAKPAGRSPASPTPCCESSPSDAARSTTP